jgi:lysophospholipase L1-like esterase
MNSLEKVIPFLLLLNSCQTFKPSNDLSVYDLYPPKNLEVKYQVEWQQKFYNDRIVDFRKKPIGFKKIVFLGNSITQGAKSWNKRFNLRNLVNRGISGDITEGVLSRLNEIYYYKPLGVFLLIGINDIFNADSSNWDDINPNYVAKNILKIAKNINNNSKYTQVYIQTILPVDLGKYKEVKGFNNHVSKTDLNIQIKEINSILKNSTNLDPSIKILDINKSFIDDNGLLISNLSHDGIHLNEDGYKVWTEELKPYITELNKVLSN